MQATEKKMNNKIWLSILSVGVVIAIILGVVGIVNHNDTKANAIPTINQQVDNINNTLPELEKVSTELKDYIDTLETTVEKLQSDLTATNTAIDTLETEVYGKEDAEKTATLDQSEQKVLDELNTLKTNIEGQIATVNTDIAALKAKDTELDGKITDLKAYVDGKITDTEEWANVTFLTLEKYAEVQTTISGIKTSIETINADIEAIEKDIDEQVEAINKSVAGLNAELAEKVTEITTGYTNAVATAKTEITNAYTTAIATAITNSETSMKAWVTEILTSGYYDIAKTDAMLSALETKLTTADEDLTQEIAEQKAALEAAKTELTAAYNQAITDAITNNNGVINGKIAEAVTAAKTELEGKIDTINKEITNIKSRLDALESDVAALKAQIQSITFMPAYSDGKVLMDYTTKTTSLDFRVAPASVAKNITTAHITAYIRYTADPTIRGTGSAAISETVLKVNNVSGDENGNLTVSLAEGETALSNDFWLGNVEAVIYIVISDGNNNIVSESVPVVAHNYAANTNSINSFDDNGGNNTYTGEVTE